jgi:tetratricopeptide (TPR) repeat protein
MRKIKKTKYCPKCNTWKPLIEFQPSGRGIKGYHCHACRNVYLKAYSQTPKFNAWRKIYLHTPEYKAKVKAYHQTLEYKAYIKTYGQTPKYKARVNAWQEVYRQTPKRKTYMKAYGQTPEYKEKRNFLCQTPGYKKKRRIYCQTSKYKSSIKAYREANRDYFNAACAKYFADRDQRTPPWANLEKIKRFYLKATKLTKKTGTQHDVDHIIPLHGKTVSGFHCETNLQVITHVTNVRKGNTWVP